MEYPGKALSRLLILILIFILTLISSCPNSSSGNLSIWNGLSLTAPAPPTHSMLFVCTREHCLAGKTLQIQLCFGVSMVLTTQKWDWRTHRLIELFKLLMKWPKGGQKSVGCWEATHKEKFLCELVKDELQNWPGLIFSSLSLAQKEMKKWKFLASWLQKSTHSVRCCPRHYLPPSCSPLSLSLKQHQLSAAELIPGPCSQCEKSQGGYWLRWGAGREKQANLKAAAWFLFSRRISSPEKLISLKIDVFFPFEPTFCLSYHKRVDEKSQKVQQLSPSDNSGRR